jgi:hypothetical protein
MLSLTVCLCICQGHLERVPEARLFLHLPQLAQERFVPEPWDEQGEQEPRDGM